MNRQPEGAFDYRVLSASSNSVDSSRVVTPLHSMDSFLNPMQLKSWKGVFFRVMKKPFILNHLRKNDFDVFHLTQIEPWILNQRVLKKARVVVGPNILGYYPIREGGMWDLDKLSARKRKQRLRDYELKKKYLTDDYVDLVLAFGEYHRTLLESIGVAKDKIRLLPPAVDPQYFSHEGESYTHDVFSILYVGSFNEYKGVDVFLRALELLHKDGVDFRAVLCGAGSYPVLKNHPDIRDKLDLRGFIPRSGMAKYYRGADVYVHPSIDEVGAGTMIESLACGTPCITTDRFCFREYDTQNVCNFFQKRDSFDLAKRLLRYYDKKKKSVINSRKYLINDRLINELHSIYTGVLENG